jgi:hypothetical protein
MNIDLIIGIDPGKTNGSISHTRDFIELTSVKMPIAYNDMKGYFKHLRSISESPIAIVEQVNMYPGDAANIGKAMQLQKLFRHYQQILDALEDTKIKYLTVMPYSWQSYLSIHQKNEEYSDRKKRYKVIAEKKFPMIKVTQRNSDSLLLAHFLKLKTIHDEKWILQNLKGERSFEIQKQINF